MPTTCHFSSISTVPLKIDYHCTPEYWPLCHDARFLDCFQQVTTVQGVRCTGDLEGDSMGMHHSILERMQSAIATNPWDTFLNDSGARPTSHHFPFHLFHPFPSRCHHARHSKSALLLLPCCIHRTGTQVYCC